MDIRFIGHASFTVRHGDVEVLCDPWFEGRVFHDGWDLYAPTGVTMEGLPEVTHIWFSHEHPDHFHVPTLRSIPPERRASLTVLFQRTIDHRVASFCRSAGFGSVVELEPVWVSLGDGLEVRCEAHREGNSWMAFRAEEKTILNLNDCGVRASRDALDIASRVGPVDVLMTQFSYAYWVGNPPDRSLREKAARDKLDMVRLQCQVLKPAAVVPIASYVYFCHVENFYLNDAINTASKTRAFLSDTVDSEVVILYPGEVYEPGLATASEAACVRYDDALDAAVRAGPQVMPPASVSLDELGADAAVFASRLRVSASPIVRSLLRPARILLWDHERAVTLTAQGTLHPIGVLSEDADVALHSESLKLCLTQPWGIDTLGVSGRLHKPVGGRYRRFYNLFRPGLVAMRGYPVGLRYVVSSLANRAAVKLGFRRN